MRKAFLLLSDMAHIGHPIMAAVVPGKSDTIILSAPFGNFLNFQSLIEPNLKEQVPLGFEIPGGDADDPPQAIQAIRSAIQGR
jgi:hypothetical protein